MPVQDLKGQKIWQRRTGRESLGHWVMWLIGVAIFAYCWQQISASTTWFFVWDAPRIAEDIWTRATPPRWEYISQLGKPIWDTLNIATLGTIFSLILAVPVAFLAARNTTPSVLFIRPIALLIIVATRSINSLIWALAADRDYRPWCFCGGHRDRDPLHRVLRQAALRSHRGNRSKPKWRPSQPRVPRVGKSWRSGLCRKFCPPLQALRCFAGTLTSANPLCLGWLARAASGCSCPLP